MSTLAVVTSDLSDEDWVFRAIDGALVVVDAAPADVVVVTADLYAAVIEHLPPECAIVLLGDPAAPPPPRVLHVVTRQWPAAHLRVLLVALGQGHPVREPTLHPPSTAAEAREAQRVIAVTRKLAAATDLVACETAIVEVLIELLECDRAYCLFHDSSDGSLWSEARRQTREDDRNAITGLSGFAARTGVTAIADAAGADPRFAGVNDDPVGDPTDHLIAHPVFGADGEIHAVLVCARRVRRAAFGPRDQGFLARLARLITPILDQLSIQVHAEAILEDAEGDGALFRREALEAQAMPRWGDVVRVSPGWLPWAYWILVLLLAGSTAYMVLAEVATYSSGVAIVRSTARTPITARTAGNVSAVEVAPGDRAIKGAVIARLDDTDQRDAAARLEREFQTQLRNHMLDPSDSAADGQLRNVRNQLDAARQALEERLIRATADGVVGDVRVRSGQHVEPGDLVASVVDNAQGLEVIALLPGEDRPQLAPGMTLRLELTGYRYAYQAVPIASVSQDVIAPNEARRVLGAEVAESIKLAGPVVLVRARLPSPEFVSDGETYRYHDGMLGSAEVRVRSEPIMYLLVPGLRRLQ
jgi:multidrug resistance efflux pump